MGIKGLERIFKRSVLLSVLGDRPIKQRDRNRSLLPAQKSSHEVGSDGAAGQSVDGHNAQSAAMRSVCRHTNNGNLGTRSAAYPRPQDLRTTGEGNDPIHLVADGRFESLFLAFPETPVGSKLDLDIFQKDRRGFLANTGAYLVPKRGRSLERIHRYPPGLFGRKIPGGKVGPVSHGPRHLQNPGLGHGACAWVVVQCAMHGTDRSAQCVGNITESCGWFAHLSLTVLPSATCGVRHLWARPPGPPEP